MSRKLTLSAAASIVATAALALSAPDAQRDTRSGAGFARAYAELPPPSVLAR